MHVELAPVELPIIAPPTVEPEIPTPEYERRISEVLGRMADEQVDFLLVYGDREHFPNLCYLTGFDPRFEEALLVLDRGGSRTLLVGNEGLGYAAGVSPIDLNVELFQPFSLIDMPRGASRPLSDILPACGLRAPHHVGLVGWKYFDPADTTVPQTWIDVPSFIVDTVRTIGCDVTNAAALLMHPDTGVRTRNTVDQLAVFEFAACHTSDAVRRVLFGLHPGMTELQAVQLMQLNGMPLNCHVMLSAGADPAMLLRSPRLRPIQRGEPFFVAHGLRGALNARAGFIVEHPSEAPPGYLEKLVAPYFAAVVAWYEHLRIGATGGSLRQVIEAHSGAFKFNLTPGQLIHLEEWLSSPFLEGSTYTLKSGMLLQSDFIPTPDDPRHFTTNIEDTLALADATLQSQFATHYPEAWSRIQHRRHFMIEHLGIQLPEDVLPFSNIPAFLPPFLLDPHHALVVR